MEYRSIRDLNDRIVDWTFTLPRDIELVVGIPRSGMLAANLLALHRDLPVTDLPGLLEKRSIRTGQRYSGRDVAAILERPARILVVDDSVYSGASLSEAEAQIKAGGQSHGFVYGAVFVTPEAVHDGRVAHFAEVVPGPRVFEWNIMHTPMMASFCVDIDGVLCADPEPQQNDDAVHYRDFLRRAQPLVLPRYEIGWLVTSRLERYRAETEDWLARHGVRYRHLVMMDYPDQAARQKARAYDAFKAAAYVDSGAEMFIESAPHTAAGVARLARRPVFCFATREMIYPDAWPRQQHLPIHPPRALARAMRWGTQLPTRAARKSRRLYARWGWSSSSEEQSN